MVRKTMILALLLALSGCVTLPNYVARPDESMATVEGVRFPMPAFCADGVGYQATPDKNGRFQVPTGSRVSLYASLQLHDYGVTYMCHPGASAVFEPNGTYFASIVTTSSGCRVDLVRKDEAAEAGLVSEMSKFGPTCNPWADTSRKAKGAKGK